MDPCLNDYKGDSVMSREHKRAQDETRYTETTNDVNTSRIG
jgi:hypothetical protein